jgi:hypothetical protein
VFHQQIISNFQYPAILKLSTNPKRNMRIANVCVAFSASPTTTFVAAFPPTSIPKDEDLWFDGRQIAGAMFQRTGPAHEFGKVIILMR